MALSKKMFRAAPLGESLEKSLHNLPQISEINIGSGVKANIKTIDFMKRVARIRSSHPLIRKTALWIIHQKQIPSNYFLDEAKAIGEFVKDRVRYVRDPDGVEYLQDPVEMVKDLIDNKRIPHGDCDDMALLTATLLLSIGHYPVFKAIRYSEDSENYNHIYVVDHDSNMDFKTKSSLVIDCIFKDKPIGYEVEYSSGVEYPIP